MDVNFAKNFLFLRFLFQLSNENPSVRKVFSFSLNNDDVFCYFWQRQVSRAGAYICFRTFLFYWTLCFCLFAEKMTFLEVKINVARR